METLAQYPEAYADLSRRVRWYWAIGIGQVLATIAVMPLLLLVSQLLAIVVFLASVLTYVPAFLFAVFRMRAFRCPRCDGHYVRVWAASPPPFASACAKCRLPMR